jgi:hypothetical protein
MSRFNPETGDLVLELADGTFKDYSNDCFGSGEGSYEYEDGEYVLLVCYDGNGITSMTMSKGVMCWDLAIDLTTIQFING